MDLLIASELILPVWLAEHQHSVAAVEPVVNLSEIGHNYLALNKQISPEIRQRLQAALDELHKNGEFTQLSQQFLTPAQ